jgi:hypothetical protein
MQPKRPQALLSVSSGRSAYRRGEGSAEIAAYEIDLVHKGEERRYLVVNARKLDDGDSTRVRLLLAVSDVTFARAEARQKDDLVREKAILPEKLRYADAGISFSM